MFENKKILVTGGSGMIGRQLVSLLLLEGANVHVADLNKPKNMSDTNITAGINKNAKSFLDKYGVKIANPNKGSLLAGKGSNLLITRAPNNINPAFIVLMVNCVLLVLKF